MHEFLFNVLCVQHLLRWLNFNKVNKSIFKLKVDNPALCTLSLYI